MDNGSNQKVQINILPVIIKKDTVLLDDKEYDKFQGLNSEIYKIRKNYHAIFYMSDGFNYSNKDSLIEIVKEFFGVGIYSMAGGVYCDICLNAFNRDIPIKINPSFSANIYVKKVMMNIPFMTKPDIIPTFNTNIQRLNLWDGFLNMMTKTLMFHIPKQHIVISNEELNLSVNDQKLIDQDIKIIQSNE